MLMRLILFVLMVLSFSTVNADDRLEPYCFEQPSIVEMNPDKGYLMDLRVDSASVVTDAKEETIKTEKENRIEQILTNVLIMVGLLFMTYALILVGLMTLGLIIRLFSKICM